MQFLPELLDGHCALVGFCEGGMFPMQPLPELDCDVRDEDAMLLPEFVDLLLACFQKVIEVMNEEHPLAG